MTGDPHAGRLAGRVAPITGWAEPLEIASPISFLAYAESSFVTGATLTIDGGRSIL